MRDQVRATAKAARQGVVAAMAMTGLRTFTRGLDLVERPPPEEIAEEGLPGVFGRIPPERRVAALELAHWLYGGAAAASYGLLPRPVRRRAWSGPVYGLGVWLFFELVLAPALGLRHTRERPLVSRAAVAGDHVLYGAVVGSGR